MYTSMFRKAMLGDTATLNLDFTTGVLDSRLTFTRAAGTATYINSSGYVTTAAANTPRFDYDPVTLAPRGLLVEGTAINIIRYSAAPQSWSAAVSGTTITDGSGLAPDNSSTPKQLAMTSGAYCYQVTQSNQVAGTYTYSVWLKASSAQSVGVRVSRTGDGSVNGMITAAVTTTWKRFEVQITSNATDTLDCGFDQRSIPPSVPGPGVAATFLMWNAQLEAGAGASSSIATGASQVTRNPDYCQSTVASGIANWLTSLTTSTYFVDFVPMTQRGGFANTWNTRTSTFQGYEIYCFDGTAGVNLTCTTKISASTNVETNVATGLDLNSRHKIAYSISAGSGLRSVNGSTVSAANPVALPTGTPSTFGVGSGGGGSGTSINAWIRSVKYYPTALTQTEINGMTAA